MKRKVNDAGNRVGVTVRDVAREAGVSVATVSRAMRGSGVVSDSTRRRVIDIANAMGYRENGFAKALARQKTDLIAVVVGDITNPFYPEVVEKLTRRLSIFGLHTMLVNMVEGADVEESLAPLFEYRVNAAIFMAAPMTSHACDTCAKYQVPAFLFNRYVSNENVTKIICDNFAGGRMVAEALIRGGHKRLAYVEGKTDTSTNKDRKAGFIEGIRASGLRKHVVEVAGEYSYEAGHRAGLRLLRYAKDVDAIFCANDILALGLLDAIRYSGGLEVPDEMSVIGFDDIRAASWPVYNLTTVRQPVDEMLEALISKLDKLDLAADERDHANIVIPGKLVARSSARLTQDYIDA